MAQLRERLHHAIVFADAMARSLREALELIDGKVDEEQEVVTDGNRRDGA